MEAENKMESRESPISIDIQYGADVNTERLKWVLNRLPWYKENGYTHIKIPESLSESSTKEDVAQFVDSEYSEEKYKEVADEINKVWPIFSAPFEELKKNSDFHFGEKYKVFLADYGPGGSYNARLNEITLDIGNRDAERLAKIVAHEIVHSGIEYLIQKYNVAHWKKERLVDLICEKYFGSNKQGFKYDFSDVDKAFGELWPNIDAITQKIGEKSTSINN